jgi:hypothetical protein
MISILYNVSTSKGALKKKETDMNFTTKASKYLKSKDLNEKWGLLCKWRRRYASHLVRDFGYSVEVAIQQAYLFGYQPWQYDHRSGRPVMETVPKSRFYRD